ncbi:ATP/GTP-binding protein [Nocardioides sp. ChNu-153]|uniref:TRAFAC clade GTPase domain-containing protein n=1 Tax=unclassified Nocardioides TaxID=2615069 RepID=UPI002405AA1F|nr:MULTISPECIES: hypothetical protein [unclassified Nocardioides]MDF9715687.1 hypothetical protein [Nocardioides sp. ChNu-99]MDN7121670.1 ATP/GTP-binding protein [Nocardioides sp. ChNu-153]
MAKYPRIREQHVAVFGESGSGKTVLVSSFFGPTQEGSYKNELWDLIADDTGQGNRLYQNYLGMRDNGTAPMATRFANTTYYFSLKLRGADLDTAKKRPFDVLRLAWHDYPGDWFQDEPSSDEERNRRTDTFRSLLKSDVALLLIDGQKLLDYRGQEERYLKSVLGNFRQNLLRLKDELLAGEGRLVEFPRIWILSLSKADLLPEIDVHAFRDLVILKAAEDVENLRTTLQQLIDTPDALAIGDDFMLLSSAKFELTADAGSPVEIDLTRRVGVDLVLPVASLLPLERRVQWQSRLTIPMKVLDSLADGAELLAAGLTGGRFVLVEKALARLPKAGRATKVAAKLGPILVEAVELAGPKLREMNEQARAQHDYLRAMLTQLKLDLEQGVADNVIRKAK